MYIIIVFPLPLTQPTNLYRLLTFTFAACWTLQKVQTDLCHIIFCCGENHIYYLLSTDAWFLGSEAENIRLRKSEG